MNFLPSAAEKRELKNTECEVRAKGIRVRERGEKSVEETDRDNALAGRIEYN